VMEKDCTLESLEDKEEAFRSLVAECSQTSLD
jgi:hypothetical protein